MITGMEQAKTNNSINIHKNLVEKEKKIVYYKYKVCNTDRI